MRWLCELIQAKKAISCLRMVKIYTKKILKYYLLPYPQTESACLGAKKTNVQVTLNSFGKTNVFQKQENLKKLYPNDLG